jgi:hypothetical protein
MMDRTAERNSVAIDDIPDMAPTKNLDAICAD